jgi:addiction module RelE/StbE family toxin
MMKKLLLLAFIAVACEAMAQDAQCCHVAPDWLLIYKVTDEEVLLARTGTHADLFDR